MAQIIPAILPESFEALREQVERVAGLVSLVQVDFVDGVYAPEATWPFNGDSGDYFEKLMSKEIALPHHDTVRYEADLMVRAPEVLLDRWIDAGFDGFVVHLESTQELLRMISHIRTADRSVGIALKPSTPIDGLLPFIDAVDFVQCMGNDTIGYHGVKLDPQVQDKIRELRKQFPELPIGVDIGVNLETAPRLISAGATRLAAGSAVFKSDDLALALQRLSGEGVA